MRVLFISSCGCRSGVVIRICCVCVFDMVDAVVIDTRHITSSGVDVDIVVDTFSVVVRGVVDIIMDDGVACIYAYA